MPAASAASSTVWPGLAFTTCPFMTISKIFQFPLAQSHLNKNINASDKLGWIKQAFDFIWLSGAKDNCILSHDKFTTTSRQQQNYPA